MKDQSNQTHQHPLSTPQLTACDTAHFTTYMQLLVFATDGASLEELASDVLHIDSATDPVETEQLVDARLQRATWLLTSGFKELFQPAG